MKHKKVISEWYEIDFKTSSRHLGGKIDGFLDGAPALDDDDDSASEIWQDNHTVLRDYDGDFSGICIYHTDEMRPFIQFICSKLQVNYDDVKDLKFKLVG